MRKKDKEFFEYMEKNFKTPSEIAELFYYFDRRVVRYRLIIAVLLMIIVLLIIFNIHLYILEKQQRMPE